MAQSSPTGGRSSTLAALGILMDADALAASLALWETRDDSKAQPEVRRAANTAMDAIDGMVRNLYAIRSRLSREIRASDDATAARVDAMLAERAAG